MAKLSSPLGVLTGSVGHLTFYRNARGENLCKTKVERRRGSSRKQQEWEDRFKTVSHAVPYLQEVIRIGFPGSNGMPGGYQGFVKVNVRQGCRMVKKRDSGAVAILDFEHLQLSAGNVEVPKVDLERDSEDAQVSFKHTADETEDFYRFADDLIYGVVLSEDLTLCKMAVLGRRKDDFVKCIALPEDLAPDKVHRYVFATTADGRQASASAAL